MLAQVATEIEAARLLVQRASWMGRNGIPLTGGQGSMSKLKSGQVAVWATRTLMDLVGPYAYTAECPLEKWFRDAKIYELFEGTAEIQRLVISRMQVAEYRERLLEAAAIAAEAAEPQRGRLRAGNRLLALENELAGLIEPARGPAAGRHPACYPARADRRVLPATTRAERGNHP